MNDDLFTSSIDDDLFDDGNEGGQQGSQGAITTYNNNPGQMVHQDPVNAANGNNAGKGGAGHIEDADLFQRLNGDNGGTQGGNGNEEDILTAYLRANGIDPENIQVDDEEGNFSYQSFSSLSRTEQLDLLESIRGGSQEGNEDYDLDNDEIDLINTIRKSNMSVSDFVNAIQNRAVQAYVSSGAGNQNYDIDQLTDDDLFVSNYKNQVPDATDEDVIDALNAAKTNQQAYTKMMQGIRDTYKQQEEEIHQRQIQESEQRAQRQRQEYENIIVNTLNGMEKMKLGDLDVQLSDDDKEEIASAILDSDPTDTRYLVGLINDPKTLSKMVWYALKGDEAIDQMQRYYKNEINARQQAAYRKGFEDAKNGKGMSYVVPRPKAQQQQGGTSGFRQIARLEDIDAGLD